MEKKGVANSEYDNVRELTISLKKRGIGLSELACSFRLNNYTKYMGTNEDKIESFLVNLVNSPEPERLIDVANQVACVSISESIPLADL